MSGVNEVVEETKNEDVKNNENTVDNQEVGEIKEEEQKSDDATEEKTDEKKDTDNEKDNSEDKEKEEEKSEDKEEKDIDTKKDIEGKDAKDFKGLLNEKTKLNNKYLKEKSRREYLENQVKLFELNNEKPPENKIEDLESDEDLVNQKSIKSLLNSVKSDILTELKKDRERDKLEEKNAKLLGNMQNVLREEFPNYDIVCEKADEFFKTPEGVMHKILLDNHQDPALEKYYIGLGVFAREGSVIPKGGKPKKKESKQDSILRKIKENSDNKIINMASIHGEKGKVDMNVVDYVKLEPYQRAALNPKLREKFKEIVGY